MIEPQEIRNIRDRADLTLKEFGSTFDVSAQTVSAWERGLRRPDDYREAAIRKFDERLREAEQQKTVEQFLGLVVGGAASFGAGWLLGKLFDELGNDSGEGADA